MTADTSAGTLKNEQTTAVFSRYSTEVGTTAFRRRFQFRRTALLKHRQSQDHGLREKIRAGEPANRSSHGATLRPSQAPGGRRPVARAQPTRLPITLGSALAYRHLPRSCGQGARLARANPPPAPANKARIGWPMARAGTRDARARMPPGLRRGVTSLPVLTRAKIYQRSKSLRTWVMVARAYSANCSSPALLMGCPIVANL